MTDKPAFDLARLHELLDKATPGPWSRSTDRRDDVTLWGAPYPAADSDEEDAPFIANVDSNSLLSPVVSDRKDETPQQTVMFNLNEADADLVVYMRNHIDELVVDSMNTQCDLDDLVDGLRERIPPSCDTSIETLLAQLDEWVERVARSAYARGLVGAPFVVSRDDAINALLGPKEGT